MIDKLTTIMQSANNIGSGRAGRKEVFIDQDGKVSTRSGLGFFKRLFSKSARVAESRATIQTLHDAIAASPKYARLLESPVYEKFFRKTMKKNLPLTEKNLVQMIKSIQIIDKAIEELGSNKMLNDTEIVDFTWYCVRNGLKVSPPSAAVDALKQYFASTENLDKEALRLLRDAGLKEEECGPALLLLKKSGIYDQAQKSAVWACLNSQDRAVIVESFSDGLSSGIVELLGHTSKNTALASRYFKNDPDSEQSEQYMSMLFGLLKGVPHVHTMDEVTVFMDFCAEKNFIPPCPEELNHMYGLFIIHKEGEKVFSLLAEEMGLPPEIAPALARNEEFLDNALSFYQMCFPSPFPAVYRVEDIFSRPLNAEAKDFLKGVDRVCASFMNKKADDIKALLAVPQNRGELPRELARRLGNVDQATILWKINELLAAREGLELLLSNKTAGRGLLYDMPRRLRDVFSNSYWSSLLDTIAVASYCPDKAKYDSLADRGKPLPPTQDTLARGEADAFTGTSDSPSITPLLNSYVADVTKEIGIDQGFNIESLNLGVLRSRINTAILSAENRELSSEGARAIAENTVKDYLQDLKAVKAFIRSLSNEPPAGYTQTPESPAGYTRTLSIPKAQMERLLELIPGSPLRKPEHIEMAIRESWAVQNACKLIVSPGLSQADLAEALARISSRRAEFLNASSAEGLSREESDAVFAMALTLALDQLNLTPEQEKDLFDCISGPVGVETGKSFTCLAGMLEGKGVPNLSQKLDKLRGCVETMDALRLILGPRVGSEVKPDPAYYSAEMDARDIPGILYVKAKEVGVEFSDLPGYGPLARVSPKLTHEEWDMLMPVMQLVGTGAHDPVEYESVTCMVAANARELLTLARNNKGRPLTAAQVWQTVIGSKPPKGLTGVNLGAKLLNGAVQLMGMGMKKLSPREAPETYKNAFINAQTMGIPLRKLSGLYTPGGRITSADMRFGLPDVSSMEAYTEANAYGLTVDWHRRQASRDGTPSMMAIHTAEGSVLSLGHIPLGVDEQVPGNPIFVEIMRACRGISQTELQAQRVIQSLSQASTAHFAVVAANIAGLPRMEHNRYDSTVTPQPNGNVVVRIANGPDDRPVGMHIEITVAPDGSAAISDFVFTMRG